MITQVFKQGTHEIKFESAESLDDAKENKFHQGIYTRYFLDGKNVDNYAALIRFIVNESKTNNEKLIPNDKDLLKIRRKMLESHNRDIIKQLEKFRDQYGTMGVPADTLKNIDEMINKLNPIGVRDVE